MKVLYWILGITGLGALLFAIWWFFFRNATTVTQPAKETNTATAPAASIPQVVHPLSANMTANISQVDLPAEVSMDDPTISPVYEIRNLNGEVVHSYTLSDSGEPVSIEKAPLATNLVGLANNTTEPVKTPAIQTLPASFGKPIKSALANENETA